MKAQLTFKQQFLSIVFTIKNKQWILVVGLFLNIYFLLYTGILI